ncbi:hypothetical protein C0989_010972 [Termitomyces sp. Mn162]|nr:hypothetical protein C0989_010972 [Termitomyces sp. Mn162]
MPTSANSNTSLANPDGPLANSDIFSTATNASPGSPEPLEPSLNVPNSIIHHQPINPVLQPTLKYYDYLGTACIPN